MKAWNRKRKPKHWAKPRWHYKKFYDNEDAFILTNRKAKQKYDFFGCEMVILIIQIRIIGEE